MSKLSYVVTFANEGEKVSKISSLDDVSKACMFALDLHRLSNLPHSICVSSVDTDGTTIQVLLLRTF